MGEERAPAKAQKGMHTMKVMDMLTAKINLLLKKIDERAADNTSGTVNPMDSRMTCKVCGNVSHSRNGCPETHEEVAYMNNGFRQQGGSNGWNNQSRPPFQGNSNYHSNINSNQPSLKDLVLGQAKINENLTKKMFTTDKILEGLNTKLDSLSSAVKS